MHITFLCPHDRVSGGTKVIFTLAHHIKKLGVDVNVIVQRRKLKSPYWVNYPINYDILYAADINKYVLGKTDFVINYLDGKSFVPISSNTKHVLYLQGFGSMDYERECINLIYKYDAVFSTSKWLAEIAVKAGHKKVWVVPPGVDSIFKPVKVKKNNTLTVGCLYHEAPSKNIQLFIAGMNRLFKAYDNMQALLISAKKPKEEYFSDLVCPYNLFVNPPQNLLAYLYSGCNVWCSVSKNEGFGLPVLEAMACGVPVVCVKSFGLDNVLENGKNCMLITNDSKEDLFLKINAVLQDDILREKLIQKGYELSQRFSWETSAKTFVKYLEALC